MSIFNDKALKGVANAVSKIMDEELKGNQHKIDANKNGKVDAHDFKLLRGKKGMKEEAEKMAKKDHDGDGKVESGKAEYLGSRIRAAKASGKLKEEVELDEAFPTVADAKKRMDAGKTSTGTVTKTKTGLVHKRDYKDDDDDAEDMQKKPKGYGARQNMGKRGQSDGTKKSMKEEKLSFTEMLHLYNESGVEVINKIFPQTVKFGDTEVELIDANIVNGAVGITVAEEVDNETFTKEVEAQKEKNAGRGKKADVAKPSVQAVKQEEVELDEALQADKKVGSYTIKHTKSDSTSSYVDSDRQKSKHRFHHYDVHDNSGKQVSKFVHEITNRPSGTKEHSFQGKLGDKTWHGEKSEHSSIHKLLKSHLSEAVEQIDEISKETAGKYLTAPQGKGANKYKTGEGKSSYPNYEAMSKHDKSLKRALQRSGSSSIYKKPSYYKEEEQLDELSKGTLGSYIKAASHDVATKGALTRHFADKSRREKEEKKGWEADKSMKKADKTFAAGWKRRQNMAKAVDRLTKEEVQLDERTLTSGETAKKEDYVKGMKKSVSGFKARYGDDAKSVMYATATKMAKKD
jgi:hypothetical protein